MGADLKLGASACILAALQCPETYTPAKVPIICTPSKGAHGFTLVSYMPVIWILEWAGLKKCVGVQIVQGYRWCTGVERGCTGVHIG